MNPFIPKQYPAHTSQNIDSLLHILQQYSGGLGSLKKLHAHLLTTGLLFFSHNLQTQLILTYTSNIQYDHRLLNLCRLLTCINPVDPIPFNSLISDFRRKRCPLFALHTFAFMHKNGVPIDTYALCGCLTASSDLKDVRFGKQLHTHVLKSGWLCSVFVGSALVDLYAKMVVLVSDARKVFDEIPERNTVFANALLSGYTEAKLWVEALQLVRKMPSLNLGYDNFTLSATLRACTGLSASELGGQVHAKSIRMLPNLVDDVFLLSALIEMYGKGGLLQKARHVFSLTGFISEGKRKRDVVLWTSMLGVYGRNGHFQQVIRLYKEMVKEGITPDAVAFVTVISACAHTGQVSLGIEYFKSMVGDFELNPSHEHYSCMVDLLCRAGELDKAWKFLNDMSTGSTISMWGALLSACNEYENVDLAELAAQRALELDPENVGIYVLLSNMYAKCGLWDEIRNLRELMKERGLEKDAGSSWIDLGLTT